MGRYRGALTVEQALHGIDCCLGNAQALMEDAQLLLNNGRPARCTALCLVGFEELGKIPMLANSAGRGQDTARWRSFWRRFRSHLSKLSMGDTVFASAVLEPDLAAIGGGQFGAEFGHVAGLREMSLYVDWLDGSFVLPSEVPAVAGVAASLLAELEEALRFHRLVREKLTPDFLKKVGVPDWLNALLTEGTRSGGERRVRSVDVAAALTEYRKAAREVGRGSRELWKRHEERLTTSAEQHDDSEQ